MRRKILHIFTITLLSTLIVETSAFAQEGGDELPVKQSTVLEKDTIPIEDDVVEEVKGDLLSPIVITPKEKALLTPEGENTIQKPVVTKKPAANTAGEKAKEQENSSNLSFNFVYYLFYKFKVGASSTSSN